MAKRVFGRRFQNGTIERTRAVPTAPLPWNRYPWIVVRYWLGRCVDGHWVDGSERVVASFEDAYSAHSSAASRRRAGGHYRVENRLRAASVAGAHALDEALSVRPLVPAHTLRRAAIEAMPAPEW